MRAHPFRQFFPLLTLTTGLLTSVATPCLAQAGTQVAGIQDNVVISDYQALLEEVSYQGLPDLLVNKQSTDTKYGVALLVARTQLRDVPEELLQKLAEQVAANNRNPFLKLVTLADLNANSNESLQGGASRGTLLDFSNNQTVLNEAIARGMAMALFVDLTHLNAKAATVSGAEGLNLLSARASLTLLNAADGIRLKGVDRDVKTRGFDARDLMDKAFDLLAKDLSQEATRWKMPELQIKLIQLEVHAKIEGIQFPMMDIDSSGRIQVDEVPVFAEGASVEIDGILKGQAPCRIDVAPGTHRLKVYRDGTKPFTATIQVNKDNRFDALLVPTEESRRKFDEQLAKFEAVKTMALKRNAQLEREGVHTDGMRAGNENSRSLGKAASDLVQSRADVARTRAGTAAEVDRTDAKSRAKVASGEANKANADAEIKLSEADAIRKGADGKLAIDKETARGTVAMMQSQGEAMNKQMEAMKSFAESLGGLGYKLVSSFKR